MAVSSSIKKYTIDGVEIPVYPTSVVPSDNLITKSWNDMNGVFKDIPVNLKTKINWVFDAITEEELATIYGSMIRDKIISTKSRFFDINTAFPGLGFISGKYYLGAPTSFKSLGGNGYNGSVSSWSCELHWIEVDGIKLNSPMAVSTMSILVNDKEVKIEDGKSILDILEENK